MSRLSLEASPYLRQHADNPVDWYPWGAEAFAEARNSDRPILLSVGYSACHWCHVMAHESFEDPETAAVMNELFVNIKVDREERPDVDDIYMRAVQALTGRGGWPMTVFTTPDGEPFYAGTYFPKTPQHGMSSFVEILHRVREVWDTRRDEALSQASQITLAISATPDPSGPAPDGTELQARATSGLTEVYDHVHGGFGAAPKFPHPMSLELLLRYYVRGRDPALLSMVTSSLDAMASGGIYDHLSGGFARYSTDARWMVPHFEKMLYDNALLSRLYLHSWQLTGSEDHLQVLDETLSFVLDELRYPEGGFYSAFDADSEGTEGRYYVWTPEQVEAVLGDDTAEFSSWFGIIEGGNFEGHNILWRPNRGDLVRPISVELSRLRMRSAREMRIAPLLDDKVLTEWNALMLSTLAEAATATSNQRWADAAVRNAEFLLAHLQRDDGRWMRSWHQRRGAHHLAFAGDLANLIDGFTRLSEATGQPSWLDHACAAADQLFDLFWDDERGGVYTTGSDAEALLTRPKDIVDDALPSANSTAAMALLRLSALTGNTVYSERAAAIIDLLAPLAGERPLAFSHLLCAVDLINQGPTEIVIPGEYDDLLDVVRARYLPNAVLAWGEEHDSALWEGRQRGRAYVCHGFACQEPVSSPTALAGQLDG
jgi:uncharacterized protein